ncbi:hypothetical protein AB205_0008510 [Aquarana catesbeiana]|uniref:Myb/SANT-like DNA-binding domain-containing protein n=1 Tax=Aquarana catesbeiana TaxID=8400 RepID=A0A2G9QAV5_AQUCT|nr:hypothetical protein AB205_0008510 [Aquarana catesbeiana]
MAERLSGTSAEESPEPQPSRSQRRYKATNMAFEEMVDIVFILRREDYDAKKGPYTRPNMRKDKIMSSLVTAIEEKFGIKQSKEQLRKWWSDLKTREPEQYWRIKKVLKKVNTCCVFLLRYLTCMLIHMLFVYTALFVKTVLLKLHMIIIKWHLFCKKYNGTGLDIHLGLDNLSYSKNLGMLCRCV